MERVVYFLGAGFSQYLGLPTMKDFYRRSKEMLHENQKKYQHFKKIIDTINSRQNCTNYYATDFLHIEEILSILEMDDILGSNILSIEFKKYIADVINYNTPKPDFSFTKDVKSFISEYEIFQGETRWCHYANFFSSILSLKINDFINKGNNLEANKNSDVRYSIITLNYDLIPEMICDYLNKVSSASDISYPAYYKLHGSADKPDTIISPTWNKFIIDNTRDVWSKAYEDIKNATQIRIIGYSLPASDTYIKYLFKAATSEDSYLKQIDIIGSGNEDTIRRYDEFITFPNKRFYAASVKNYIGKIIAKRHNKILWSWNGLEEYHENFMQDGFNAFDDLNGSPQ